MHHGIGLAFLVAAIGFAFGKHTARAVVGVSLAACALAFLYVLGCIVTGSI